MGHKTTQASNEVRSKSGIAMALLLVLLGATVILGWHLGNRALLQIHPSFVPMQYNAALGFLLVGGGLLAWEFGRSQWILVCGIFGTLVGGLTLVEYVAATNLGIDELLMTHDVTVETSHPGRMAPNTAVCLLLSSVSLLLLAGQAARSFKGVSVAVLGALVTGLGAVALFGYLSRMETAYGWGNLTRMALHTSAGYLVAGHALMWIAWRIAPKDDTQMPAWASFLPVAFGVTGSICIWQAMIASDNRLIQQETKTAAVPMAGLISNGLTERIEALARMGGRWENDGGTPRAEWERDATQYLRHTPSYRALEWVDANNRVRWIIPLKGNESALGFDLSQEEDRRVAMDLARSTGQTSLSIPVDLIQGGKGLLAFVPLKTNEQFGGFILGVFDIQILLESLVGKIGDEYVMELVAERETFYRHFTATPQHWDRWGTEVPLEFFGVHWQLRLAPTDAHLENQKSVAPFIVLLFGSIGSILFSGVIRMFQRARREQGATQRANVRFQQVIESSPIGMLIVNHVGTISFANHRAEEIFDYAEGDLTGRPIEELVPQGHRHNHAKHRHDFEKHGEARLMVAGRELFGVRRDGTEVPVEIGLAPIDTEEGRQVIASVLDVTQRHEAEQRSRELTERLRLATESAEVGIWDWYVKKNELIWDDTMYQIYGVDRGPFTGAYEVWKSCLHPEDREWVEDKVKTALDNHDQPYRAVYRALRPNGEQRYIQAYGIVQRDESGAAVRMLGTNWDVTEEKEAELLQKNIASELESRVTARTHELKHVNRELEKHAHALENSNRDLESFAYVASHDLQEPLRKIRAFGDILREDIGTDGSEDALDSLETITSSAERMSKLIEALLVFSRVSHQAVGEDDVDLNEVMRDVLSDLQLRIEKVKADIKIAPLGRVRGDAVQLRSLFQNLVGNSLNYHRLDAPMVVDITSEHLTDHETGHTELRLHVRDSGKGFEQENAEQIFKPFKRLEGRSSKTPGTGIGLAICRRIVERHHGTITAQGEPGVGAEFIVTLPASNGEFNTEE